MSNVYNDIIIVGAGPTGLMLANQLSRFSIDYIIIDKKSGPTNESRALAVQARSMEIYEQLGLSDKVIADAQPAVGVSFYRNGKYAGEATIADPDEHSTPFPNIYIYEQSKNEILLYQNLQANHKEVEWDTAVMNIEKNNELYSLQCKQNDKDVSYQCKYLIACDGSKSIVRDFSQVPFTGGTYFNIFYVADTHVNAGLSKSKLSMFFTVHGLSMFFPMKEENHFRILGILPKEYYHHDEIPFSEILDKIKLNMKMPIEFYDTNWHSTYKLHHKKVARFNKDNIFFAGDAAHVHSPAGGQGMNTGLQDAYNLAWKLALIKKEKASGGLLETYHEERNPIAESLLKSTDRLFTLAIKDGFGIGLLRTYIVPVLMPMILRSKSLRKKVFALVSQIKIAYLTSSLAKGQAEKINAGMRLPYFKIMQQGNFVSIYTLTNTSSTPFTIILYSIAADEFSSMDKDLFSVKVLEKNNANEKSLKEAGFPTSFVMIVRPDNYISYINENIDLNEMIDFMREAYFLK